jgi:hypothetical protein
MLGLWRGGRCRVPGFEKNELLSVGGLPLPAAA